MYDVGLEAMRAQDIDMLIGVLLATAARIRVETVIEDLDRALTLAHGSPRRWLMRNCMMF